MVNDIDADVRAREKLKKAAKEGHGLTLTAHEVTMLDQHLLWLAEELESLLCSGAFDDD